MELYEKNGSVLFILEILKKYSNEDNLLSSKKISELIEEEYNVKLDSRKIRRDINLLIELFGYDIETYNDNNIGYMLRRDPDKDFELGELQIIIDTFSYSNFVPENITKSIVDKCLSKMNKYEQEEFKNYKAAMKNTKTNNREIINNIEIINEAIKKGKKITFEYYKYTINNNKVIEEKVQPRLPYRVSPYKISYNLQKLYLFCLKDGMKKIITYRLDRMKNIQILKEKINDKYTKEEIDHYIKNNVSMFIDDLEKVVIECDMSILDNVIETYGKDIKIEKINNKRFKTTFYTVLEGFKYWCLRNLETVNILEPTKLNKEINKIIKEKLK